MVRQRRPKRLDRKENRRLFSAKDFPWNRQDIKTIKIAAGKKDEFGRNLYGTTSVGARVAPLFNHATASDSHQDMVSIVNDVQADHHESFAVTEQTKEACRCHVGYFKGTKRDGNKKEDLLMITRKENGVAYRVCDGDDRLLGRGGFGIVYKGLKLDNTAKTPVRISFNRTSIRMQSQQNKFCLFLPKVAIKVVQKSSIQCFEEDDEFGLVTAEVAMLNRIKGHPNAIQLVDYVEFHDFIAIIMERPLNCKDLFEILADQTSIMSETRARKIFKQLSGVLLAMEKKNIVHRDIKAENVLVDVDNEQVKLIDFGLATTYIPGKKMKKFSGTEEHTPPEFILEGEYEAGKETVWTLGLLLFYLVCGEDPFRNLLDMTMKPLRVPPYLSSDLKDLLLCMLRKDPSRRLTLEQVYHHPWMIIQTNALRMPFGYRRNFKQKI